jgi:hypothetical protein
VSRVNNFDEIIYAAYFISVLQVLILLTGHTASGLQYIIVKISPERKLSSTQVRGIIKCTCYILHHTFMKKLYDLEKTDQHLAIALPFAHIR